MKTNILVIAILFSGLLSAQINPDSDLFKTLKKNDSLLFDIGFNTCNLKAFEGLLSDDLEFYHDKGGITHSKAAFIANFTNGLCKSPETYQSRRELHPNSLNVFPLYDNGKLYGAIQQGVHSFYEHISGKEETYGSTAKFTHLWILKDTEWQLARVLSYDHQTVLREVKRATVLLSENMLKAYAGRYETPKTGAVYITTSGNGLQMKAGKMEITILPESETVFFAKEAPLTFEFIKSEAGRVVKMLVKEHGKVAEEAIKME